MGIPGLPGDQGEMGDQGAQGIQGGVGDAGEKGPVGPRGKSLLQQGKRVADIHVCFSVLIVNQKIEGFWIKRDVFVPYENLPKRTKI